MATLQNLLIITETEEESNGNLGIHELPGTLPDFDRDHSCKLHDQSVQTDISMQRYVMFQYGQASRLDAHDTFVDVAEDTDNLDELLSEDLPAFDDMPDVFPVIEDKTEEEHHDMIDDLDSASVVSLAPGPVFAVGTYQMPRVWLFAEGNEQHTIETVLIEAEVDAIGSIDFPVLQTTVPTTPVLPPPPTTPDHGSLPRPPEQASEVARPMRTLRQKRKKKKKKKREPVDHEMVPIHGRAVLEGMHERLLKLWYLLLVAENEQHRSTGNIKDHFATTADKTREELERQASNWHIWRCVAIVISRWRRLASCSD